MSTDNFGALGADFFIKTFDLGASMSQADLDALVQYVQLTTTIMAIGEFTPDVQQSVWMILERVDVPSAPGYTVTNNTDVTMTSGGLVTIDSMPWTKITGKPAFFSGAYADLTGKPTIPTSFSSLVNSENTFSLDGSGVLTFPNGTTSEGNSITIPVDESLTVNVSTGMPLELNSTFKINPESIKLPTGNGIIYAGEETAAGKWSLDSGNKTLYFPDAGDGVLPRISYSTYNNIGMELKTYAKGVRISTQDGFNESNWTFSQYGDLTLPAGGDIVDSTGTSVLGGGGSTLPANASGYLTNDGSGNLAWAAGDGTFSGAYADLTGKPTIVETNQTVNTGDSVSFNRLTVTGASGIEGGEIQLAKAPNSTLAGDVIIDVYGDKLRFFEGGGNGRGFYLDLTTGANNTNTNIMSGGGSASWPVTNTAGASGPTEIAIGQNAGLTTQGDSAVAIGKQAGETTQGNYSVAVGQQAGTNTQGASAVAVGYLAGTTSQGASAVAIGVNTGSTGQGTYSVAIGAGAGYNGQGNNSVAIGLDTGLTSQGDNSVAIGSGAGETEQSGASVAIGYQAGQTNQDWDAVAVGAEAGKTNQGGNAVAIGESAAKTNQGGSAVAIGEYTGATTQGARAVAVGVAAGENDQGDFAVAIGDSAGKGTTLPIEYVSGAVSPSTTLVVGGLYAANIVPGMVIFGTGFTSGQTVVTVTDATTVEISAPADSTPSGYLDFLIGQGENAVAIGAYAGYSNQAANSIIINATGVELNQTTTSTFTVAPIRNASGTSGVLQYNTTTKEVTYSNEITVNSNVWTFGTDGNITLPAGGDILVDDGKIISADGEDFKIIVQDSDDNGNRLDLVVTDGTDQATRVEVDRDGVQIVTNLLDAENQRNWTFKSDGTTEFPNYTISQYSSLKIKSGASSSTAIWTFGTDGALTLPAGGIITEGGGLTGAIKLTPSGGANEYQALLIYPTAAGDGDHIHLTAGGGTTELYLGNDRHYVKLANTGNVEVQASTGVLSATAAWTFDTAGNIDAQQALGIKVPDGVPSSVTDIIMTTASWELNPNLSLATTGGSGTGLTVNITETDGYVTAIAIATAGTGYTAGDYITVTSGTSSAEFIIAVAGRNTWQFGDDGTLTLPAGGDILDSTGASVLGGGTTLPANASGYLINDGTGALSWAAGDGTFSGVYADLTSKPTLFDGDYNSLTNKPTIRIAVATGSGPGGNLQADSLALAGLNPTENIPSTWGGDLILQGGVGGSNGDLYGEVRIKSGTIGANYEWHFTTDKKLKLPAGGDIVNSTGTSVMGGSGSYAPAVPTNWAGTAPTTIAEALDRVAVKLAYLSDQGYGPRP